MNNIHNNFSVQIAKGLSQIIHNNQKDKSGNDYMLHVLKVAGDVEHLGPDYYIVGLLHDVIEDAGENKTELLAAINSFFNRIKSFIEIFTTPIRLAICFEL